MLGRHRLFDSEELREAFQYAPIIKINDKHKFDEKICGQYLLAMRPLPVAALVSEIRRILLPVLVSPWWHRGPEIRIGRCYSQ